MSEELFSERYAATYDHVYAQKNYLAECDLLEQLFDEHAQRPVRSVLDLGCGTGRHAIELARRGYDVVGVDRSQSMLARARATASHHHLDVRFELGDLRSTRLSRRFDAVLMMFAVLGYQLTDDDVDAALRTVQQHLQPGGVFCFDVWHGPAVTATGPEQRRRQVMIEGQVWQRTSYGVRRMDGPVVDVTIELEPMEEGQKVSETHSVRYFDADDLELRFTASGLELVALHPIDDLGKEPDAADWNVIGTARPAPADG